MRGWGRLSSCFIVCAALLPAASDAVVPPAAVSTGDGALHRMKASGVARVNVTLSGPGRHRVRLEDVSFGATPFVRVLAEDPLRELARGEGEASVVVTKDLEVTVVIHAARPRAGGKGALFVDGRSYGRVVFGGTSLPFAGAKPGTSIVTLQEPRGPSRHRALVVAGSSPTGALLRFGDGRARESLELDAPREPFVVVAGSARPREDGALTVALNDKAADADGDGLGDDLERALGTCAHAGDVLDNGWRCDTYPPTDGDQDGLPDGDEVLGACDATACESLRRLGADPGHKDVFVEVDYSRERFDDGGERSLARTFTAGRALDVWRVFRAAPPDVIRNPDGRPGVALHFDVAGALRLDAMDNEGLLDASGGSGAVEDCREYAEKRPANMSRLRQRWFHWWCATRDVGSGQATPAKLAFTARADRPGVVAHELGHALGLGHGGAPDAPNGKASYVSLMNYGYQNWQLAFSDGGRATLNPTSLCEQEGLGHRFAGRRADVVPLAGAPWFFRVDPRRGFVDWNRDGRFSTCEDPVQASATFATFMGTSAHSTAADVLSLDGDARSVGLLRVEDRLFALAVQEPRGEVLARVTPYDGRCPEAQPLQRQRCGRWTTATTVPALHARTLAASSTIGAAWLALAQGEEVHLHRASLARDDALQLRPAGAVPIDEGADVELLALPDQGAWLALSSPSRPVRLLRLDAGGRVVGEGHGGASTVPVTLALHPPSGRVYLLGADDDRRLSLSVLHDDDGRIYTTPSRLYRVPTACEGVAGCRGKAPFHTVGRPGLAWSGAERGHWVVSYVPREGAPLAVLELRRRDRPGATSVVGLFGHAWTRVSPDAGVRMLRFPGDDRPLALAAGAKGRRRVSFFPFADGIFDAALEDHDDFKRIEAGICHPFTRAPLSRPCGRPGARWRFTPAAPEPCAPSLEGPLSSSSPASR